MEAVTESDRGSVVQRADVDRIVGFWIPIASLWAMVSLTGSGILGAGAAIPMWVQLIPFALSAVFLGMPHGALDGIVVARLVGRPFLSRRVLGLLTAYLGVSALVVVGWVAAPLVAFGIFIAITWFHWGQGDLSHMRITGAGAHLDTRFRRVTALASRGAIPMLAPMVWFPEEYRATYAACVAPFAGSIPSVSGVGWQTASLAAAVGLITLIGLHSAAVIPKLATDGREVAVDLLELGTLVAFFASVPAILAVGVYFCLWHSIRHIYRVAAGAGQSDEPTRWSDIGRTFIDSAPLTILALILCAWLGYAALGSGAGGMDWLGIYLVAISALTVPHVLVILWLDRVESVWRT
jgi:Brp/Blh family beta-carotene 15,15'-monooxygenase